MMGNEVRMNFRLRSVERCIPSQRSVECCSAPRSLRQQKVRPDDLAPTPEIEESVEIHEHRTLQLESLFRMKLTAFRHEDRMHLRDMLDLEPVDETWLQRLQPELAARLQQLLDDPEG